MGEQLTCLHLVLEGHLAVLQEAVERPRLVRDREVELLAHLDRVVEVHDLRVPVVGVGDEVEQDLDHGQQELARVGIGRLGLLVHRVQGCKRKDSMSVCAVPRMYRRDRARLGMKHEE